MGRAQSCSQLRWVTTTTMALGVYLGCTHAGQGWSRSTVGCGWPFLVLPQFIDKFKFLVVLTFLSRVQNISTWRCIIWDKTRKFHAQLSTCANTGKSYVLVGSEGNPTSNGLSLFPHEREGVYHGIQHFQTTIWLTMRELPGGYHAFAWRRALLCPWQGHPRGFCWCFLLYFLGSIWGFP